MSAQSLGISALSYPGRKPTLRAACALVVESAWVCPCLLHRPLSFTQARSGPARAVFSAAFIGGGRPDRWRGIERLPHLARRLQRISGAPLSCRILRGVSSALPNRPYRRRARRRPGVPRGLPYTRSPCCAACLAQPPEHGGGRKRGDAPPACAAHSRSLRVRAGTGSHIVQFDSKRRISDHAGAGAGSGDRGRPASAPPPAPDRPKIERAAARLDSLSGSPDVLGRRASP